jgi:hypothetical protein
MHHAGEPTVFITELNQDLHAATIAEKGQPKPCGIIDPTDKATPGDRQAFPGALFFSTLRRAHD